MMSCSNRAKNIASIAAAAGLALAAVPTTVLAQSQEDPWKFRAQIYLWLPTVDGNVDFPASSNGSSAGADVNFGDYFSLSNLQGTFMGAFEARKGRWGVLTDFIYLDFDQEESGTRNFTINAGPGGRIEIPVGASADAGLRLRGWEWSLVGTYSLAQAHRYEVQALGGLRYLKVDVTFDWGLSGNIGSLPPQAISGNVAVKPDYWDGIVGVRGRLNLGDTNWYVPYYLDVGTGESKFTWQAIAGIGYKFGAIEVLAAYRYLDYKFKSNSAIQDLSFGGPGVSLGVAW
jgi:opacity protein-like surface antigen